LLPKEGKVKTYLKPQFGILSHLAYPDTFPFIL